MSCDGESRIGVCVYLSGGGVSVCVGLCVYVSLCVVVCLWGCACVSVCML